MSVPTTSPTERYMFVFVNFDGNNNKDYVYEVWDNNDGTYTVMGKYGRVNKSRQTWDEPKIMTRKQLDKMLWDREHKDKYKPVQLHVPSATPAVVVPTQTFAPITTKKVADLIDIIFSEANEYVKTYVAAAVESLSQGQIDEGRKLLTKAKDLYDILRNTNRNILDDALIRLVQEYYSTIPTQLPYRIDKNDLTRTFVTQFDEQNDRLDQLEAQIATIVSNNANPSQSTMQKLGANISLLDPNSARYKELYDYARRTHVHTHFTTKIRDIFEVEVPTERQSFTNNTRGKHHTELLFHGTGTQNVRHILRTGLIVPVVNSYQKMFGNGIYFANMSSKSTNYCSVRSYNRGIPHMMFIAEVALGDMWVAPRADHTIRQAPSGYDSVWGKAHHTGGSFAHSSGTLQYDEFIVYTPQQATLRYLITFDK